MRLLFLWNEKSCKFKDFMFEIFQVWHCSMKRKVLFWKMQINSFPQKPDETGLERKLTFFLCHKYFAQRRKVSKKNSAATTTLLYVLHVSPRVIFALFKMTLLLLLAGFNFNWSNRHWNKAQMKKVERKLQLTTYIINIWMRKN